MDASEASRSDDLAVSAAIEIKAGLLAWVCVKEND